jgi:glyoxylase-like metal-dependent hydrolase (beta-lactamase superfamily II)
MTPDPLLTRRLFLADLGKGALAVAVLGIAACAPSDGSTGGGAASPSPGAGSAASSAGGGSAIPAGSAGPSGGSAPPASGSSAAATTWTRVNLGFVSAYILARGGEAAIVDTGVPGSEGAIQAGLQGAGLDWSNVAHVILTHKHGDHAGSIGPVLTNAATATGYIGAGDLAAVSAPRALTALNDGDRVFDLRIVATPGHTRGHISVLDEAGGILAVGDALRTDTGQLTGSNPQFTEDATQAGATIVKLGGLTFETLLPGHGEPITSGAAAQVKALAGG